MAARAVVLALLLAMMPAYAVRAGEPAPEVPEPARPRPFFLQFYTPPKIEVEAKVAQYALPLKPDEIVNWAEASKQFKCEGTAELILANGFAVEEGWGEELGLISSAYENLPEGVPMFVTVDTALHVQHVLYDQLFGEIETAYMVADLEAITAEALKYFASAYAADERRSDASPKGRTAVRRTLAYFGVGARLLDPKTAVPEAVEDEVTKELRNIEAGMMAASPLFIYWIDYSQFKPRGHYTKSETLQRYFRAMTWYAQGAFLFQGGTGMIVDAGTADIQTMQAIQIGRFFVENEAAYRKWQRMQAVLEFFAGTVDDVSVADVIAVKKALDAQLAVEAEAAPLGESEYLARIREKLLALPRPTIHAATGLPIHDEVATPERRNKWLEQARGLRLFGQRLSFDGYAMSEVTGFAYMGEGRPFTRADTPVGPVRGYPTGLDVMTLLGSTHAEELLRAAGDAEYAHYDRELARLKQEFAQLTDDDWHGNLAMCRLNLIRMLLEPVPQGYPTAMQAAAWRDRRLGTSLASWAQLKHDVILAHKQPWDVLFGGGFAHRNYAEPCLSVYLEMRGTSAAIAEGLSHLYPRGAGKGNGEKDAPDLIGVEGFLKWLDALLTVSAKELRHEALSGEDCTFLGSLPISLFELTCAYEERAKHPAVVADVHTEPNEERVVEVATGRFNLLWVVYQLPSGEKVLGAGPVMSYYEFKQPMAARLTDEEWRETLDAGKAPEPPTWMKTFLSRKKTE
jgi:hypothetical protein